MKGFFSRLHDSQTGHSKSTTRETYKFWVPHSDSERKVAKSTAVHTETLSAARPQPESRTSTRTPKPFAPPVSRHPAPPPQVDPHATRAKHPSSSATPLPQPKLSSRHRDDNYLKPQPPSRSTVTPAYQTDREDNYKSSRHTTVKDAAPLLHRHEVWLPTPYASSSHYDDRSRRPQGIDRVDKSRSRAQEPEPPRELPRDRDRPKERRDKDTERERTRFLERDRGVPRSNDRDRDKERARREDRELDINREQDVERRREERIKDLQRQKEVQRLQDSERYKDRDAERRKDVQVQSEVELLKESGRQKGPENLDGEKRDMDRRDSDKREKERRETQRKELEKKETERREMMERNEAERREAERRESEKRVLEKREAERREVERRETEKRAKDAERRENERREAERRELAEKRELERRELERREMLERQAERREAERREVERRDLERRDAERREAERREAERLEAEKREADRRETERREVERREAERREVERRDAERKEMERIEADRKEAERRELERKETERREFERKEAEKRETEKREAERRQAEKREAERREAERREAERREAERREAERREAERRETERREAERREAERREAERREAERREAERREAERKEMIERREAERREVERREIARRQEAQELERLQQLEKQRELERQREVERQRQIEIQREAARQKEWELERQKEVDRQRREAERLKEIEKQREFEEIKRAEMQKVLDRQKEAELQRQRDHQAELDRLKEVERRNDILRQREFETQRELELQREAEKQKEVDRQIQRDKQREEKERERRELRRRDRDLEKVRRDPEREKTSNTRDSDIGANRGGVESRGRVHVAQDREVLNPSNHLPIVDEVLDGEPRKSTRTTNNVQLARDGTREQRLRAEATDSEDFYHSRGSTDRLKRRESLSGWATDSHTFQRHFRPSHRQPDKPSMNQTTIGTTARTTGAQSKYTKPMEQEVPSTDPSPDRDNAVRREINRFKLHSRDEEPSTKEDIRIAEPVHWSSSRTAAIANTTSVPIISESAPSILPAKQIVVNGNDVDLYSDTATMKLVETKPSDNRRMGENSVSQIPSRDPHSSSNERRGITSLPVQDHGQGSHSPDSLLQFNAQDTFGKHTKRPSTRLPIVELPMETTSSGNNGDGIRIASSTPVAQVGTRHASAVHAIGPELKEVDGHLPMALQARPQQMMEQNKEVQLSESSKVLTRRTLETHIESSEIDTGNGALHVKPQQQTSPSENLLPKTTTHVADDFHGFRIQRPATAIGNREHPALAASISRPPTSIGYKGNISAGPMFQKPSASVHMTGLKTGVAFAQSTTASDFKQPKNESRPYPGLEFPYDLPKAQSSSMHPAPLHRGGQGFSSNRHNPTSATGPPLEDRIQHVSMWGGVEGHQIPNVQQPIPFTPQGISQVADQTPSREIATEWKPSVGSFPVQEDSPARIDQDIGAASSQPYARRAQTSSGGSMLPVDQEPQLASTAIQSSIHPAKSNDKYRTAKFVKEDSPRLGTSVPTIHTSTTSVNEQEAKMSLGPKLETPPSVGTSHPAFTQLKQSSTQTMPPTKGSTSAGLGTERTQATTAAPYPQVANPPAAGMLLDNGTIRNATLARLLDVGNNTHLTDREFTRNRSHAVPPIDRQNEHTSKRPEKESSPQAITQTSNTQAARADLRQRDSPRSSKSSPKATQGMVSMASGSRNSPSGKGITQELSVLDSGSKFSSAIDLTMAQPATVVGSTNKSSQSLPVVVDPGSKVTDPILADLLSPSTSNYVASAVTTDLRLGDKPTIRSDSPAVPVQHTAKNKELRRVEEHLQRARNEVRDATPLTERSRPVQDQAGVQPEQHQRPHPTPDLHQTKQRLPSQPTPSRAQTFDTHSHQPSSYSQDLRTGNSASVLSNHTSRHQHTSSLPTALLPSTYTPQHTQRSVTSSSHAHSPFVTIAPEKHSSSIPRNLSEETILMTPSSLAQSNALKPSVSRQSASQSISSQTGKKGLLDMFRRAPKPSTTQQYEVWHPAVSSKTPDSSPGYSKTLEPAVDPPTPPKVVHPVFPVTHEKKGSKHTPHVFSPFKYLRTKKQVSISDLSLEAQDGTAPNTVVGSPTTSMHSQFPPPIHVPPLRDPWLATEEWRDKEEADVDARAKSRRQRPGVVIDVAEETPEDRARPKRIKTRYRKPKTGTSAPR